MTGRDGWRPEVGDLVRYRGENAVVIDIIDGMPRLQPLDGGHELLVTGDPRQVKVQARKGTWSMP
ncbi:hypothetical protein [Streptomyces sp. NPDC002851]